MKSLGDVSSIIYTIINKLMTLGAPLIPANNIYLLITLAAAHPNTQHAMSPKHSHPSLNVY